MPELPEVETIRLGLQKYLVGRKIQDVQVGIPKMFAGEKRDVIGAKIVDLRRIGKGLIIELDNGFVLAVHLKMTGQLVYRDAKSENIKLSPKTGGTTLPSKYSHVIFILDNNAHLYYNDLRRFGWIKVVKKDGLMKIPFFQEMGPEPFVGLRPFSGRQLRSSASAQKFLTSALFNEIVKKGNIPIKVLLMDQKRIGGIGNIYANDALFEAKIDPRRKGKTLSDREINKLYNAIFNVIKKSLKYGGSSDENFVNALGQEGNYQNHTLVYGKEGEPCKVCRNPIEKIKLGGRGTYFCPVCQR